jgi:hypothetical protein
MEVDTFFLKKKRDLLCFQENHYGLQNGNTSLEKRKNNKSLPKTERTNTAKLYPSATEPQYPL